MVRTFMPQPGQEDAQITLARRFFLLGCLGLPWLHVVNVWYFWGKVFGAGGSSSGGSGSGGGSNRGVVRPANPELKKWVSRSLVGAVVGFALLAGWILLFQLRWKAWGSRVVPFMITTPEQYSTGW